MLMSNLILLIKMDGDISGNIPLSAVGSAVYRATVLINHSCCPNTIKYYHGGKMILVAREHISAGREITNNYGVHHWQIPRKQRRERLLSDYKVSTYLPPPPQKKVSTYVP